MTSLKRKRPPGCVWLMSARTSNGTPKRSGWIPLLRKNRTRSILLLPTNAQYRVSRVASLDTSHRVSTGEFPKRDELSAP